MVSNFKLRNIYSYKIQNKIQKINKSLDILSKYNKINQKGGEYYNLKKIYNKKLNNKLNKFINNAEILLNFDRTIMQHGGREYKFINDEHTVDQIRSEIDTITVDIEKNIIILKELIITHEKTTTILQEKTKEISDHSSALEKLQEELNITKANLTAISLADENNKKQINDLNSQIQDLTSKLSNCTNDPKGKETIAELQTTITELQTKLKELTTDNENINKIKLELEAKNTNTDEGYQKLYDEKVKLQQHHDDLEKLVNKQQKELQEKISMYEAKLKLADQVADHHESTNIKLKQVIQDKKHSTVTSNNNISLAPMGNKGFTHDTIYNTEKNDTLYTIDKINPMITKKCKDKVESWLKTHKNPTAEQIDNLLKSTKDINQAELLQCLHHYDVKIPNNLIVHTSDKIPLPTPKPIPTPFTMPSARPQSPTKTLDLKPLNLSKKNPLSSETSIDSFHTPFKKTDSIPTKPPLIRSNSLSSVSPTKPPLIRSNSLGSVSPTKPTLKQTSKTLQTLSKLKPVNNLPFNTVNSTLKDAGKQIITQNNITSQWTEYATKIKTHKANIEKYNNIIISNTNKEKRDAAYNSAVKELDEILKLKTGNKGIKLNDTNTIKVLEQISKMRKELSSTYEKKDEGILSNILTFLGQYLLTGTA